MKYESLTEALYIINPHRIQMAGDPLFQDNKKVNKLFHAHKYQEIINHNRNCLVNEAILFLKRWYKNYRI